MFFITNRRLLVQDEEQVKLFFKIFFFHVCGRARERYVPSHTHTHTNTATESSSTDRKK